ncbi:ankyrin repeat-containing domain protein [Baffinella frigidus]|nr:ankyrin repeat-containing domain protein [Cryptophyta sp. CCMP2293]
MASPSTAAALAAPASEPPALSDPPASSRAEVPQAEGKAEKVADDESEAESGTNRTPYSQKMEEALSCVICHCIFYNCVSLSPCMHSFCKGCVAQSLARSRNGSCPICRCTVTAAPPNCVIREVVSVFTDNHPERKRKAEEMANLDEHSKSLDRFFERRGRKRGDGEARSPEAAGGDGGEDVGSDDVGPEDEEGEELGAMLLMGSFEGSVSQVDEALFEGADVNTRDRSERTPVHFAAMKGNLECLRKLLAAGGDVEPLDQQGQRRCEPLDQQGQTPLCMAAEGGHDSCVRLLMEAGVNINEMTPYGDFPLHIAVQMGHNTVVETLLAANANVGTYDADGYDALALACQGGHTACVKALLRVGADVNGPGEDNMCPLLHAVDDGHEACVNELLAAPGVLVQPSAVGTMCRW